MFAYIFATQVLHFHFQIQKYFINVVPFHCTCTASSSSSSSSPGTSSSLVARTVPLDRVACYASRPPSLPDPCQLRVERVFHNIWTFEKVFTNFRFIFLPFFLNYILCCVSLSSLTLRFKVCYNRLFHYYISIVLLRLHKPHTCVGCCSKHFSQHRRHHLSLLLLSSF